MESLEKEIEDILRKLLTKYLVVEYNIAYIFFFL